MAAEKKVKFRAPRASAQEDPNLFVSVNGVNYLIPKGETVELPDYVVAEIERAAAARDAKFAAEAEMIEAAKRIHI